MDAKNPDEFFMRRAIELAKRAWGDTSPNPMVGAVLAKSGRVISEGYHKRDGGPHAEIECLRAARESPEGATLYVSLEPCSTKGRTGACCEAIIAAKIGEVIIGATDPNPAHNGRAPAILRAAGIKCRTGILERECEKLNFIFNFAAKNSAPLVALKYAVSRDGMLARRPGERTRITSEESIADVMKWRRLFSAIAVGRGTLESDNPALTSRGFREAEYSPIRLVFDAALNIAKISDIKKFRLFSDAFAEKTRVVCGAEAPKGAEEKLADMGIKIMRVRAEAKSGSEFWAELKKRLFEERVNSLYIEGGAGLIKSVCGSRAADFAFEYRSPEVFGAGALPAFEGGKRPFEIGGETVRLGADTLTCGNIKWSNRP